MRYRTRPRVAYLAGRFERKDQLIEAEIVLAEHNILPGTRWLHGESDMRSSDDEAKAEWALKDTEDVLNADFLIAFSEDLSDQVYSDDIEPPGLVVPAIWARGGRHVEFGIALGNGMDIAVIGPKENLFHYANQPGVEPRVRHFDTLTSFIEWYDENNVLPDDAEFPVNILPE